KPNGDRPPRFSIRIPVEEEVEKVKKEWDETYSKVVEQIKAIEEYGKSPRVTIAETQRDSLPRMNGLAQDGLALLNSLQFKLDLFAPQLPTDDQVQSAKNLLESWKNRSQSLRLSMRNANLQAKDNMRKAAQKERELLLGGGEESTVRRRNLQTKAGMTSAAESITESLRRTRQLMVQEVERTAGTLMTFAYLVTLSLTFILDCVLKRYSQCVLEVVNEDPSEDSTGVLRKAESEYKGHRSLLMRTRNLLSTMQRQDVIDRFRREDFHCMSHVELYLDRVILVLGIFLFSCAVLYVGSKRVGLLALQRQVTAAIKAGMGGRAELRPGAVEDVLNHAQVYDNAVHKVEEPLERLMHDEL
ncbi:Sec20 family protein, partial [Prunus dulcis]